MGDAARRCDRLWHNARLLTCAAGGPGLGQVDDGVIACRDGGIVYAGLRAAAPSGIDALERIDCSGRWITPGLIDCHTHLVYAGDRADEFERRLNGESYEAIARAGGGIASTVRATRAASEAELVEASRARLLALVAEGVTTVEIKSGYGLELSSEHRQLSAAATLGREHDVSVVRTFLGAHALPPEFAGRSEAYVSELCERMLPQLSAAGMIDAVDAFCEHIGFSAAQTRRVFEVARAHGLPVKLHADQLSNSHGAALAAEFGALSADHLEYADEAGVAALARAGTTAVLLPGAFYFTRETQLPPLAALRAHGVSLALATDCNPGSSPLCSLLWAMNLAATLFRMTVAECLIGVTRAAAQALGLAQLVGTLEAGKDCDLAIWNVERPSELVYRMGCNPLHARVREGPMTRIVLEPAAVLLAGWRAIYAGASVELDREAGARIASSAAAVQRIVAKGAPIYGLNTGFGKLASVRIDAADLTQLQKNLVLSHASGVGEPMPRAITRLMIALKLASLAQGASGVRPETVALLGAMLERDVLPCIPAQGSVGASGDLAPLSHLAAALIGVGDVFANGERMPAASGLPRAGLAPLVLVAKEGLALLNGTQFSTACALAGLFGAEQLFQSALVTGALATEAAKGSDTPFDPRIHALRRHRGQIETAAALRALMAGSEIRASHLLSDPRVQDPYCLRCQPQVMGAALDVLRQAAATLELEANGVSDNPLIFAESDEALSGGNFHAEPVAFAADMIALAVCEIGSLAERRVAMLVDPALSGLPAFLTPRPGINSGLMLAQVTAAALVSENKQRAYPASVDSIPTSANQEDHVSMAAHGARRLLAMNDNARNVVAIELMAAAQGCDFHHGMRSSAPLEAVRRVVRSRIAPLAEDRFLYPDLLAAHELVHSGAILTASAEVALPGVAVSS